MTVTTDLIGTALGRPAPASGSAEEQQWNLWIADALMLIEARLGDPAALNQAKLDYVVREAVVAQVRRPDDATQVAVSVDDGSVSRTYRTSSGRVEIRDEWWDLLAEDSGESGKAYSVDTAPLRTNNHAWWCARTFGANWCSCGAEIGQDPIFEVIE